MNYQDPQWAPPRQGYPPAGAPYNTPYAPPSPYAAQQQPYGNKPPRAVKNPLATRAHRSPARRPLPSGLLQTRGGSAVSSISTA